MILPWHTALWARLSARGGRAHHGLLFAGPAGGGKRRFAEALAAAYLCDAPGSEGFACGHCESCTWLTAGTHPDCFRLVPEADEGSDEAGAETDEPRSRQIKVQQVRAVQDALVRKGHRSDRRSVLIDPADAMNAVTANGLLKLLEEPPAGVQLLLVSSAPDRLMPTIRSRTQRWDFPPPAAELATRWLAGQGIDDGAAWLGFCGGMPLAALALAGGALAAQRRRFMDDMLALPQREALGLAGEWDAWLRSKDAAAAGLDMPRLADWWLRWMFDLTALAAGAPARYFPDAASRMQALAGRLGAEAASGCYNDALRFRRVATHPLNARLLLEDTLLRYARHLATGR